MSRNELPALTLQPAGFSQAITADGYHVIAWDHAEATEAHMYWPVGVAHPTNPEWSQDGKLVARVRMPVGTSREAAAAAAHDRGLAELASR